MKTKNVNKGFTLIEVLLVIVLIGILLTIALVNFNSRSRLIDARNDIRKTHIQTLESTITQYKLQKGSYPTGLTRDYQEICDPDATSCTGFIDLKSSLVPDFLQTIPQDPNDTDNTGGSGYEIAVDEASNTVSIRLKEALREGGIDIKVNDPLPSVETSNANTPLAATVPKFPIVTDGLILNLDAGNPVSYPGTGNIWFDLSGLNNNAIILNDVGYNINIGTLDFYGNQGFIQGPTTESMALLSSFTISAWIRHDTLSSGINRYVTLLDSTVLNQTTLNDDSLSQIASIRHNGVDSIGQLNFYITTNGTFKHLKVNGSLQVGSWYYVVGTWDGTKQSLYKNAVQVATQQPDGVLSQVNFVYRVSTPTLEAMDGNVAQVYMYNRALNLQEIQQNFNATRGRFGL